MSEANAPTPNTPEASGTFRFLGQDLRPLGFGELLHQSILFLFFSALFSWLAPGVFSPANMASSFVMLCFWNAGLRLSVASILFFFGLAVFGVPVFEGIGRLLGL